MKQRTMFITSICCLVAISIVAMIHTDRMIVSFNLQNKENGANDKSMISSATDVHKSDQKDESPPIQHPPNDTIIEEDGIASTNNNTTIQDDKCKRMFEWSSIYHWKEQTTRTASGKLSSDIDFTNLPQTRLLQSERMGGPSATGINEMKIGVFHEKLNLTIVHTGASAIGQSFPQQGNLWHRMVSQYSSWFSLQVAQRRYNLVTNHTIYLFNCKDNNLDNLPPEWSKIGKCSCDKSLLIKADVVIVPPIEILWDLAWDFDFQCHNSDMFKKFASLFIDPLTSLDPLGCYISRKGRDRRIATNFDEVIRMMYNVFPRVRVLHFTKDHTTDETIDLIYDCKVLFGIHGAGHMNAMFAKPGVAAVEMVGGFKPAYFRNINMLLGHHYEAIKGDSKQKDMTGNFTVDLVEAQAALERARDFSTAWIKQYERQG